MIYRMFSRTSREILNYFWDLFPHSTHTRLYKAAVSSLVAIRHLWRQAQFLKFRIDGNFKYCELNLQSNSLIKKN